jgi:hypothetical protein
MICLSFSKVDYIISEHPGQQEIEKPRNRVLLYHLASMHNLLINLNISE